MNWARLASFFYIVTFVAGTVALVVRVGGSAVAAGAIAGTSYIVVTLLLYGVFRPVSRVVSAIAALVSCAGIVAGLLRMTALNPLVLFGCYCLLLAYLIARSTFAPRWLAGLMMFAGLGWLTFISGTLAHMLTPYNFAPGMIGEGALTIWLLMVGDDHSIWTAAKARQS